MKIWLSALAAMIAFALPPSAAHAHYIWATVENGQVRFALLESVNEAPSAQFATYVADITPHAADKTLTLGAVKDGARYADLVPGQNVILAESVVGPRSRDGAPYLLIYDAKGTTSLAAAAIAAKAPAEILARREGQQLIVTVLDAGVPVANCDVWVQWPGTPEGASVATDAHGEAHVLWAALPTLGGFIGVRALVTEARTGESEGKTYASVHRWATLSVPAIGPVPPPEAPLAPKPFHVLLRESFGNNHEVVSDALFNKTVFDDKITRTQLIIHLQQRALIHNEVHRILIASDPALHVPYGPAQRQVLVLLFKDLIDLGSGWPTEEQAMPLTRDFLMLIRDSEKRGPYFALGVQHVYFGGITNGGRMIGAEIGKTLKFTPTYYEKSDGYAAYVPEVDKISDPAARAEMIRGGQAAYRYIIAISNEPVFKAGGDAK